MKKEILGKLNQNNELKISKNQYILPSINLLKTSNEVRSSTNNIEKRNIEFGKKLEIILKEYGVEGKIINFKSGPVVTLYEFVPAAAASPAAAPSPPSAAVRASPPAPAAASIAASAAAQGPPAALFSLQARAACRPAAPREPLSSPGPFRSGHTS